MKTRHISKARGLFLTPWIILVSALLVLEYVSSSGQAQVVTNITPSGLGTTVAHPNGPVTDITGGTRPESSPGIPGPNLFHSFGEFNVGEGDVANFLNDSGLSTQNILSRVTGGNPSEIFGKIQTTDFHDANLFLLNPKGIVFGPNASIDIGGAFYASNADFIQLGEDDRFYASLSENSVLTSAMPQAFGFLGSTPPVINSDTPATIKVEGLTVISGGAITLIGRDAITSEEAGDGIIIQSGTLTHSNGNVNLVSIGASQAPQIEYVLVNLDTLAIQGENSQKTPVSAAVILGNLTIDQGAAIDTSGYGGGTIKLRGGNLTMEGAKISANVTGSKVGKIGQGIDIEMTDEVMITNGSILETNVTAEAAPGNGSGGIRIKGTNIEIRGDFDTFAFSELHSDVAADSLGGRSGNITIEANSYTQNLSVLHNRTDSIGHSGNIVMDINQNFNMNFSTITTESGNAGNAGDIDLSVQNGNLTITEFSALTTQANATGNAGEISISVERGDVIIDNFAGVFSRIDGGGTGGSIEIHAANMTFNNRASIGVENFSNQEAGGLNIALSSNLTLEETSFIDVIAEDAVAAADTVISAKDILLTGGSSITTETQGSGRGGNLAVQADNLFLSDASFMTSAAEAAGHAGNINIELNDTFSATTGGKIVASTSATGDGGTINITANTVMLTEGGIVTADSTATDLNAGDAGDIALTAQGTMAISDGLVTTKSKNALGGNIKLTANDLIQITNSDVTSQVQEGSSSAGKIDIDPDFVVIRNSNILSTAVFGDGGPISITANSAILVDPTSVLDASSQFGGDGTIDIQSPIQQLSGAIAPLPESLVKAVNVYAEACASIKGGQFSSLVRSTDPVRSPTASEFLTSPLVFDIGGAPRPSPLHATTPTNAALIEAPQKLPELATWQVETHTLPILPYQVCARSVDYSEPK